MASPPTTSVLPPDRCSLSVYTDNPQVEEFLSRAEFVLSEPFSIFIFRLLMLVYILTKKVLVYERWLCTIFPPFYSYCYDAM